MSQIKELDFYPPREHPYVFVNKEYLKELLSKRNHPDYKGNMDWLESQIGKPLPTLPDDGCLSASVSRQLETRAFLYVLGFEDETYARQTADFTIKYLTEPKTRETYSISIYKDFGTNGIGTGALVYDWCYNALTEEQRVMLAERVRALMYAKEQPCRPDNVSGWSDIVGKSVGQPLVYNSISAVALYDIYPDIYNSVMPKILGSMADMMRIYGTVGAMTDGSISYTRDHYAYNVEVLFARMGYYGIYGDQRKLGYRIMYSRTPYGALIKMGDDFSHAGYKIGSYVNRTETTGDLGLLSALYNDPYLRFQYLKENYNRRGVMNLLLTASDAQTALPDELPLALEVTEPRCDIIARTSWQSGLDSPSVLALLSMNNRRTGDHDHAHIGSFQLYYKGPLTIPGGIYSGEGWGRSHWKNYYTRTVSGNCITVYDPSEKFVFGSTSADSNDGGQRMVHSKHGGYTVSEKNEHMSDENIWSTRLASYIGPDEYTPAFSYIKGDLTASYTDKVRYHRRSMVFMDTFEESSPGALIVFDRVISSDRDFKKSWLLQCVSEPRLEGDKITVNMTDEGCNGRLVNRTLLPEGAVCVKVGEPGRFITDGAEYPADKEIVCSPAYAGGIRCEVSPSEPREEDIFLNAMYVTDADSTAPEVAMTRMDTPKAVGVLMLDRLVLFSRNAEPIDSELELEIPETQSDTVTCFIADLAIGKWQVRGKDGFSLILDSDEKSGCIVFKAPRGKYVISRADEKAATTPQLFPRVNKSKTGDFAVKVGGMYTYARHENKIVRGVPFISADTLERYCDVTLELLDDTLTLRRGDIEARLTVGSLDCRITSGESVDITLTGAPFIAEDGSYYIPANGELMQRLGICADYVEYVKLLKLNVLEPPKEIAVFGIDKDRVIRTVGIKASSDDGNIPENTIDGRLDTRWSSLQGDGEWICYDLGEVRSIDAVHIGFYNGDKRRWRFDIQLSSDGKEFRNALSDMRSGGVSMLGERFELPRGSRARYVRYVGHGEEVTQSLYNSLTRFIITAPEADKAL